MENNRKNLGARIQAFRKLTGKSQSDFADDAGVGERWVQEVERGALKDPGIDKVALVADELQISIDELYYGEKARVKSDATKSELVVACLQKILAMNESQLRSSLKQLDIHLSTGTSAANLRSK